MSKGKELKVSTFRIRQEDFNDKKTELAVMSYIDKLSNDKKLTNQVNKWIIEGAMREIDDNYKELNKLIESIGIENLLKLIHSNKEQNNIGKNDMEAFGDVIIKKMIESGLVMKSSNSEKNIDQNNNTNAKEDEESDEIIRKRNEFKNRFNMKE